MGKKLSALDMLSQRLPSPVADPSPSPAVATSEPVHPSTRSLKKYERTTVYLTHAQREWLMTTGKGLPHGLSSSDLARWAIEQAMHMDMKRLVPDLVQRAHYEAEQGFNRKNAAMP